MERRSIVHHRPAALLALGFLAWLVAFPAIAEEDFNNPGIMEPVSSALMGRDIRVPNTDQSVDGLEQSLIKDGEIIIADATESISLLGHPITRVTSPNDDMRLALQGIVGNAIAGDQGAMQASAADLMDILMGTTEGRIYDGYSMLNFNRFNDSRIGPEDHPADLIPGEYKMKWARDTGETAMIPNFDGEGEKEVKVWEVDINMLYYDGQIDSDTFFVRFPFNPENGFHDWDDLVRVNYRIYSLVQEDFSPTLVMLDRREALDTVQFPFKGFDAVWVAFFPGEVVDLTIDYPPARMLRGVYTWGWREHPPRIQFMQPLYELQNQVTGEYELDPQSYSYAYRNRKLTIDQIGEEAPEKKMYHVAQAVLDGANPLDIIKWMTEGDQGPRGTWIEWADLAKLQTQLPPEAKDLLEEEGLPPGDLGDYNMVTVFMNNEMYGTGPFLNEIKTWKQGETFKVKLINFDNHTHYFRNVDFGARLNDDILNCCGGGETSFEVMNFKPSYGAPKVAEMQWRAGWGFRPHHDVIQQQGVFSRASDRVELTPYTSGDGNTYTGYLYSEEARDGDFRFNPPPFIIVEVETPSENPLRDADGDAGLIIGQRTEGYGVGNFCPGDPYPGFCTTDIQQYNPNGVVNFPPAPLQGQPVMPVDVGKFPDDIYPDHAVELRYPPFLRNPCQGEEGCGDIIPPTGAWRPFLWTNPANGTLYIDPDDPSKGYWADLTYSHGAPVFAGESLDATIELPRASGQVFYQFDDLFHDNAIFSPHPVAGIDGDDPSDEVTSVRARVRGDSLRVQGSLSLFSSGEYAAWVSIYDGPAGDSGCTGSVVMSVPVDESGRFVARQRETAVADGSDICVQSVIGGYAATVAQ